MVTDLQYNDLLRRLGVLEEQRGQGAAPVRGPLEALADEAAERVTLADLRRRAELGEPGLTGAKNVDMILSALRRLEDAVNTTGTPGTPGTGSLGSGWTTATIAERSEILRDAVCAILAALNGAEIVCNGDGTITLTLPDLPADLCA